MHAPTPPSSAKTVERRRSLQELLLAVLVVVLMSRFLSAFALHGQGPLLDEPAHIFTNEAPRGEALRYDVLGTGRSQDISCTRGTGSHWTCVTYEIREGSRTIFSVDLMGHNDPGRIWFSQTAGPRHIIVWQPWNSDEFAQLQHPVGYWRYDYDGNSYDRRPLLTSPLLLWLESPLSGLDL